MSKSQLWQKDGQMNTFRLENRTMIRVKLLDHYLLCVSKRVCVCCMCTHVHKTRGLRTGNQEAQSQFPAQPRTSPCPLKFRLHHARVGNDVTYSSANAYGAPTTRAPGSVLDSQAQLQTDAQGPCPPGFHRGGQASESTCKLVNRARDGEGRCAGRSCSRMWPGWLGRG